MEHTGSFQAYLRNESNVSWRQDPNSGGTIDKKFSSMFKDLKENEKWRLHFHAQYNVKITKTVKKG